MVSIKMNEWNEFVDMDKNSLLNLVIEKDKRIQDLERLVEDQKRLRLQDSNQVEEKAAKIKEWVTNKLKELENQNRQLRDQNRKHKETVESLTTKLATLSPISTPRRRASNLDRLQHYSEHSSPIETIDVDKSLKCRKPQLKKSLLGVSSSSDDENKSFNLRLDNNPPLRPDHELVSRCRQDVTGTFSESSGKSIISIGATNKSNGSQDSRKVRQESPLYDSVNIEHFSSKKNATQFCKDDESPNHDKPILEVPPPLPPHQTNKWEMHLYNLVDQTLSSIKQQQPSPFKQAKAQKAGRDDFESPMMQRSDTIVSRKSSTSSKNDFDTLMHPTFTTIEGDEVVEDFSFDSNNGPESMAYEEANNLHESNNRRVSHDQTSQSSGQLGRSRNETLDLHDHTSVEKQLGQNLFDSPMRSRSVRGDNILRTQSVRKNPVPEKLYDFISADLVKRGYLVKIGALKNHNRWFVLKNFHLYSFKRESDETAKVQPSLTMKLDTNCHINILNQSNDGFPFKIAYLDKTLHLVAESAEVRDEWIRVFTVAINLSDIDPVALTRLNSTYESIISVTRHGHTKRCHAVLVGHIAFFLKSYADPTPLSYLSVKGSKIREITDIHDYDSRDHSNHKNGDTQDCSLAIYPKYSMDLDPVYMNLGCQQETDAWLYFLSQASGIDQSHGTQFERTLAKMMINNSMMMKKPTNDHNDGQDSGGGNSSKCVWREQAVILYSDKPITQPLTSLSNETLQLEAIEMSKSILLFTQVPLEPVAIDYHVFLLQNCIGRILKCSELRNEFYAQLIKQSTYVVHRCSSPKLSSSSSGCSSLNPRSSFNSLSLSASECQFVTDMEQLGSIAIDQQGSRFDQNSGLSQLNSLQDRRDSFTEYSNPPTQSELLQVLQILAVAVSLNLPRGRLRWWLVDHLKKFANPGTNIGKYAMYTLRAIDRTSTNGIREFIPSRMEIMGLLLRNPYDHSKPHSLPVNFADGSYLVVETDGSTTVEEFMMTMGKCIDIRHSSLSDFYLFTDDPIGSNDSHILEPQRKVLDVVGWWEQTFRQNNSGRYQNTKVIKIFCKKRLTLRKEMDETDQEKLLIVHQTNQEIISQRLPLNDMLTYELASIMAQLSFGDFDEIRDPKQVRYIIERIKTSFMPPDNVNKSSHDINFNLDAQIVNSWKKISGKSSQDCVRVYLNCIRRLKLSE